MDTEKLTVSDLRNAIASLQAQIQGLLNDFTEETGVPLKVEVNHYREIDVLREARGVDGLIAEGYSVGVRAIIL